jgi:hypothetical protein
MINQSRDHVITVSRIHVVETFYTGWKRVGVGELHACPGVNHRGEGENTALPGCAFLLSGFEKLHFVGVFKRLEVELNHNG